MRKSLKETIMERDSLEEWEADDRIEVASEELEQLLEDGGGILEAEHLIQDHFDLEPDYLDDLLNHP